MMPEAGDVVWIRFPGVVATKQRPAVVISSRLYHVGRPDVIVGLVTSQITKVGGPSDYILQDWKAAGLRVPSAFRTFLSTLPATAVISTLGKLSAGDLRLVKECVKQSLELQ